MAPKKTFEAQLEQLEKIVEELEEGTPSLDKAIGLFQKGRTLARDCEKKLKEAEGKILQLLEEEEGSLVTQSLDAEEDDPESKLENGDESGGNS